ncbi:MAG: sulfurtransferase [Cytophagales bacterium]|nr:sulfurtransferase [Cytophagales bacterium]
MSTANFNTLISVQELQALQASQQALMIFDCSFDLAKPEAGYAAYLDAHIAGAVYANLDKNLSHQPVQSHPPVRAEPVEAAAPSTSTSAVRTQAASGGRHPLPSREQFAAWLSSIGFTNAMQAVVYDRNNTMIAGRLWWMLQWLGHERAAVLDGGFQTYIASQAKIGKGFEPSMPASQYQIGLPKVALVDAALVAAQIGSAQTAIVDARATPRFNGEVEPLDPVAGHIPSALNRPFTQNFAADGRFKSPAQLRTEFGALLAGRDPAATIHHCGSGVSALPNVLAMAIAGLGLTTLYAGSWSDWCSDPARPVAQSH